MATVRFTTRDGAFTVDAKSDGTVVVLEFVPTQTPAKPMRGLGDAIARATSAVGIKPCGGCKKRQEVLNDLVPFKTPPEG
jgi:hypothetical protein